MINIILGFISFPIIVVIIVCLLLNRSTDDEEEIDYDHGRHLELKNQQRQCGNE